MITKDGSHTIKHACGDTYHSIHGSIQESQHIYIDQGLLPILETQKKVKILEVGFGTGLNTYLTALSLREGKHVHYTTYEPYPIEESVWRELNYPKQLGTDAALFERLHHSEWDQDIMLTDQLRFVKKKIPIQKMDISNKVDLIYFDAFAPGYEPDLWTKQVLESMRESLRVNGVLVSYCTKGEVKRRCKEVGFECETIPGPQGKREMLRLSKI